jgi:LysM repeat protein
MYTVEAGDTLAAIARTYGVSIDDLMTANGLTDPNVLQVGQTLIIPVAPPSLPDASPPAAGGPSRAHPYPFRTTAGRDRPGAGLRRHGV